MRIVLITGSENRHACYANIVQEQLNLVGVVVEKKRVQIEQSALTDVVEKHQQLRGASDSEYFGSYSFDSVDVPKTFVNTGEANSEEVFEWVKDLDPDYVLLYGSSIIKDPLLSHFDGKIINLHLGLSPYYKGAATLFWPVVEGELGALGTTFHIASAKVDAGPIIHQVRPEIEAEDTLYDMGNKAMKASFVEIGKVVNAYHNSPLSAQVQRKIENAKLFKKKDFKEEFVQKAWKNVEEGLVKDFVANKNSIFAQFPIITCD